MAGDIKVVSFDLWDTVLIDDSDEPKRAALGRKTKAEERRELVFDFLARHRPVPRAEVDIAYAVTDAAFRRVWYGQNITWSVRERLGVLLAGLNRTLPEDELRELVRRHEEMELEVIPDLLPGIADALGALHGRYRLAVISDAIFSPGRVLRQILEHHRLLDLFDVLVFSDEVGCSKPDPRVFKAVLEETGCTPRELVHVGDREQKDVAGAHAVGSPAILVPIVADRGGPDTTAEAICHDYGELPALIDGLDC
jgi:putative hydrolase of the HAD superfamily